MPKKLIGITIIVIGLLLMGGIVWFVMYGETPLDLYNRYFTTEPPAPEQQDPAPEQIQADGQENNIREPAADDRPIRVVNVDDSALREEEERKPGASASGLDKDDLLRMAASFAERFGSYSNQSDFSNIIDLKLFMTARMKAWAEQQIEKMRQEQGEDPLYYSITTKAVDRELVSLDEAGGRADILVRTRRREAGGTPGNYTSAFSQDISVKLVKENNAWKVDGAYWE